MRYDETAVFAWCRQISLVSVGEIESEPTVLFGCLILRRSVGWNPICALELSCTITGAAIPRYLFNYRISGVLEKDPESCELPSDEIALEEAQIAAREMLAAKVRVGDLVDRGEFEITTGDGTVVHTLPLRSELKLDEHGYNTFDCRATATS